MRRDRQADELGFGQFDAAAHHAAGDVELGFLGAEHLRGQHEQHRIDAIGGDHLAGFASLPPRLAVEPAMLAGRAIEPDAARPVQHLPVAADVDAAGVGRRGQRDVAGADVAAAVARPELRCREGGEVDGVAGQHHVVDRRLGFRDANRRDPPVHDGARLRDHLGDGEIGIEPDRERVTLLARAQHVGEDGRAGAIAGNIFEQQRRRVLVARRHIGDGAKLLVGVDRLGNALKLVVPLQQRDPFAEIPPAHLRAILGRNSGLWRSLIDELFHGQSLSVMAGLVPAIHALLGAFKNRNHRSDGLSSPLPLRERVTERSDSRARSGRGVRFVKNF